MLERMSDRQKVSAAIAVLGLNGDDKVSLDKFVSEIGGNPLFGALTGKDITSVEGLILEVLSLTENKDNHSLSSITCLLKNKPTRAFITKKFVDVVNSQPPEIQAIVEKSLISVAEMDIKEFRQDFANINHFIEDGLLLFIGNSSSLPSSDPVLHICEDCGHINEN